MKKKKSTTITTWNLFIIRFSFAWSIVSYDDVKYWKTKVHLLGSNIGNKKFTKNNHNLLKSLCASIKYNIKQSLEKFDTTSSVNEKSGWRTVWCGKVVVTWDIQTKYDSWDEIHLYCDYTKIYRWWEIFHGR